MPTKLKPGDRVRDRQLDCIVEVIEVIDWKLAPFTPTARVRDLENGNVYEVPLEWLAPAS
jgi:hypothetical protein